jgi:hypothetical protein
MPLSCSPTRGRTPADESMQSRGEFTLRQGLDRCHSSAIVHQRRLVCLEIGEQITEVALQGRDTLDVADTLGFGPARDAGKLDQAAFPAAVPKTPLRALDIVACYLAEIGINCSRSETCRSAQDVIEAHGHMEPYVDIG